MQVFSKILLMSIGGGVVGAIILFLTLFTRKRFSFKWNYYIFLIPIILMLIPLNFGIKFNPIDARQYQTQLEPEPIAVYGNTPVAVEEANGFISAFEEELKIPQKSVHKQSFDLRVVWKLFTIMWFVFVISILAYRIITQMNFRRELKRFSLPAEDRQNEILNGLWHGKTIGLKILPGCGTPFIAGIFKPVIYIPEMSEHELYLVLRHELTHIKRHDLFYKWIVLLVVDLHFFNPIAYLMKNEIYKLCELSCDESVIRDMDINERKEYGKAILNLMKRNNLKLTTSAALSESEKNITERIDTIMNRRKMSKFAATISMILVLTLTITSVAFASAMNSLRISDSDRIVAYYDEQEIKFSNNPFIEDGELYLPLREILNACNIEDNNIRWENNEIQVWFDISNTLPEGLDQMKDTPVYIMFKMAVGESYIYSVSNGQDYPISSPILLKGSTTYIPLGVLLRIKHYGALNEDAVYTSLNLLDGLSIEKYNLMGNKDILISPTIIPDESVKNLAESYYEPGENVFIGTKEQQEEYGYYGENEALIKRIIVNEMGAVLAVVPVEYQLFETTDIKGVSLVNANGWSDISERVEGYGIIVRHPTGSLAGEWMACINPDYQINLPLRDGSSTSVFIGAMTDAEIRESNYNHPEMTVATLYNFFSSYEIEDYEIMKTYCSPYFIDNYFHDGDVYGNKWAKLISHSEIITSQTNPSMASDECAYFVNVEMETVPTSSLYPSAEGGFFVIFKLINNGLEWKIDRFVSGL